MSSAAYFPYEDGSEDTGGADTCGWNESLTWVRPPSVKGTGSPCPAHIKANFARWRAERRARRASPAETWRQIHPSARELVVMFATERARPAEAARMAWESFSAEEQAAMAAFARTLHTDLAKAERL